MNVLYVCVTLIQNISVKYLLTRFFICFLEHLTEKQTNKQKQQRFQNLNPSAFVA